MSQNEFYNLIIIGCGAAGITAALSASVYEKDILILDRNLCSGRKIAATGNGKCNFTNLRMEREDFRSCDAEKVSGIINRFNNHDVIKWFDSIGIPLYERNGYCYPYSNQAASVRNVFDSLLKEKSIKTVYNCSVYGISRKDGMFIISAQPYKTPDIVDKELKRSRKASDNISQTSESFDKASIVNREVVYSCRKLVIAAGGSASPCFGTDGSLYNILKTLGHNITDVRPALTGLISGTGDVESLAGVRHEALISLICRDTAIYSEYGEIVFSSNGVSGIPVMNASGLLNSIPGANYILKADFYHTIEEKELADRIINILSSRKCTVNEALNGFLNNKLLSVMMKRCGIAPDCKLCNTIPAGKAYELAHIMKHFSVPVTDTAGFDGAQTTAGGISLSDINTDTMESLVCKNLYLAGEILDVDGRCGGYNLQWAWSSGAIAGACAAGGYFDKNQFIKA